MGLFSKFKKEEPKKPAISQEDVKAILDAKTDARKDEKFRLAGTSFYQEEVIQKYGKKNQDYYLKAADFKKKHRYDTVYEYDFPQLDARLVPEPENEHDPNAIAVYAGDVQVGYIKKGSTGRVRNILKGRNVEALKLNIKSGNYKFYDEMEERVESDHGDLRVDLIISHSES